MVIRPIPSSSTSKRMWWAVMRGLSLWPPHQSPIVRSRLGEPGRRAAQHAKPSLILCLARTFLYVDPSPRSAPVHRVRARTAADERVLREPVMAHATSVEPRRLRSLLLAAASVLA